MKLKIRPLDYPIFALAIGLFVGVGIFSISTFQEHTVLEVVDADQHRYEYSLSQDRSIFVEGPLGTSHIAIQDGMVSFVTSPCNDKICILAGKIHRAGQWIACLPNKVFIKLKGVDSDIDRIST